MKQRLGLAASLLSKPKLLILDEPTNGLDPSGILDFREVVKKAAKERGMAVFVSSHILSEVQELCDKVAFINDGVIKSVEKINTEIHSMETDTDVITLVSNEEKEKLISEIKSLPYVSLCEKSEKGLKIILKSNNNSKLVEHLVTNNFTIEEIYKERKGLEQRYMELVEGGIR